MPEKIPYGTTPGPVELGHLLRAHRKRAGLTQAETAALCGVGVRFLRELEHGKATAELGKALQVIRRLGLVTLVVPRGTEALHPAGAFDATR